MISVVIPAYNAEHYIDECLESILGTQKFDLISEILVSDNASNDRTYEKVLEWRRRESKIAVFKQEHNLGACGNFNFLIKAAAGKFVKMVCADDILIGDCISLQYDLLMREARIKLATCNMEILPNKGGISFPYRFISGIRKGAEILYFSKKKRRNYIGGPTNFMFRKEDIERIQFRKEFKYIHDLVFGLELLGSEGSVGNIGKVGYKYRIHDSSETSELMRLGHAMDQEYDQIDSVISGEVPKFPSRFPFICADAFNKAQKIMFSRDGAGR